MKQPNDGGSRAEPLSHTTSVVEHRMTAVEAFSTVFMYLHWAMNPEWDAPRREAQTPEALAAFMRLRLKARHDYALCTCELAEWQS